MSRMLVLLVVAVTAVTVVAHSKKVAYARLIPNNPSVKNVNGWLKIEKHWNGFVTINGKIYGLSKGLHGLHVHEKGDLSNGCTSTGAHFNPKNVTHGGPKDTVRHVGDLGNIQANSAGEAVINITDKIISIGGPNCIMGRSIVVHSGEDDLGKGNNSLSLTNGNAGDRWACGVISRI